CTLSHMRAWALALLVSGCGFTGPGSPDNGSDGNQPPGDAPPDGGTGDTDASVLHVCLGTFVNVCMDAPQTALSLMTQTINTDTYAKCLPAMLNPQLDACVIAGQTIPIPSSNKVTFTGT